MILNSQFYEQEIKTKPPVEQPAFVQKWTRILSEMDPITLEQSGDASLMKRTDTKFVFPSILLPAILGNLKPSYRILEVDNGIRLQRYQTLYFDTPDFQLYQQHHNGQCDRFKLRVRSYLNSDINYLEVKKKDNHNVTQKSRMQTLTPSQWAILGYPIFPQDHTPVVDNAPGPEDHQPVLPDYPGEPDGCRTPHIGSEFAVLQSLR